MRHLCTNLLVVLQIGIQLNLVVSQLFDFRIISHLKIWIRHSLTCGLAALFQEISDLFSQLLVLVFLILQILLEDFYLLGFENQLFFDKARII